MNAKKIEQNKQYEIAIGKNTTVVRVVEIERRVNGSLVFQCENVKTGKPMVIADCERFRKEVKLEKKASNPIGNAAKKIIDALGIGPGSAKAKEQADAAPPESETKTDDAKPSRTRAPREDGTVSGIEAALIVLREAGEALNIKQIMEKINERGLAKLGKTPGSTVSAAIQREISHKPETSRFEKAGKGLFRAK